MAKKGNLLSGEKALAAVANFDIAERLVVLQSCELAQSIDTPTKLGSTIPWLTLERICSVTHNAQQEVLAHRKIDPHNAQQDILAHRKIDPHNALMIGNVISQTAAASNSVKLNKKGPKIDP